MVFLKTLHSEIFLCIAVVRYGALTVYIILCIHCFHQKLQVLVWWRHGKIWGSYQGRHPTLEASSPTVMIGQDFFRSSDDSIK